MSETVPLKRSDRRIINSRHFRKAQRRHFILLDVLPSAGTLIALGLLFVRPIGWLDLVLFFALWLVTGLGVTVGYHRLFTHGSFSTTPAVSVMLIAMASMAGRGPMLWWVAIHRRHHELSDREGDMHSPNLHGSNSSGRWRGFLHSHLTWMFEPDYPNVVHYVPDLLAQRSLVAASGYYYGFVVLGLIIPATIGGIIGGGLWGALTGLLWGGAVRIFVVAQTISAINSLGHSLGRKTFATRGDHSRNLGLIAWLGWGEGWHNNHHAFPYSAAFGLQWYEFDPGFQFIRLLEKLGLAWDIKVPTAERMAQRALVSHAAAVGPDLEIG